MSSNYSIIWNIGQCIASTWCVSPRKRFAFSSTWVKCRSLLSFYFKFKRSKAPFQAISHYWMWRVVDEIFVVVVVSSLFPIINPECWIHFRIQNVAAVFESNVMNSAQISSLFLQLFYFSFFSSLFFYIEHIIFSFLVIDIIQWHVHHLPIKQSSFVLNASFAWVSSPNLQQWMLRMCNDHVKTSLFFVDSFHIRFSFTLLIYAKPLFITTTKHFPLNETCVPKCSKRTKQLKHGWYHAMRTILKMVIRSPVWWCSLTLTNIQILQQQIFTKY